MVLGLYSGGTRTDGTRNRRTYGRGGFSEAPSSPRASKAESEDGLSGDDLSRSAPHGIRSLVRAGVPERVARAIRGHKTRSVFERYNIVSANDIREAGKKLGAFHGAKVIHISCTKDEESEPQVLQ
jgi:hypothetical protein